MPRVPSLAAQRIGDRLKEIRRSQAGMTQDELAAATGIDSANIRAIESGRSSLSIQTLVRLAVALDVKPGELIDHLTVDDFADVAERRRTARRERS